MLPIYQLIWHEFNAGTRPSRVPEPEAMEDAEQVRSYATAYEWGGAGSALQLHHLKEISHRLRPGSVVLDLACGPGPVLLELAALYPDCRFIGADLSGAMLAHLRSEVAARQLQNVSVLQEDICVLGTLAASSIDLVICTAAMHHLPDSTCLRDVFRRIKQLLKPQGGFYLFDFGLLKSEKTRKILVKEMSKLALPITTYDYEMSLKAAFPIEEALHLARAELPAPFEARSSLFIDFLYFLMTPKQVTAPDSVQQYIKHRWQGLSFDHQLEHRMLRLMQRARA